MYVCVCAYYYNSVLCYCLWQLFTSPLLLSASHRDADFEGRRAGPPHKKGKHNKKQTHFSHTFFVSEVSFLKVEVVHQILFTLNLIFKQYFRPIWGEIMKVLHFFIS